MLREINLLLLFIYVNVHRSIRDVGDKITTNYYTYEEN